MFRALLCTSSGEQTM